VVVEAAGQRYEAPHAVITVSTGVLRANRIAFDPPLPQWKREAIDRLPMGNMQKVIIPFRRDIFGDEPPNSWVLYEGELPETEQRVMAFVIKPLGTNIAIGFFGGNWAKALEGRCQGKEHGSGLRSASGCDDLSIRIATAALSHMYGEAAVAGAIESERIHLTRWSLDETSLGAYSAPEPGHWDKHEVLRRPVGNRLFFAGEGTARAIYNGSYPGAYESGLEAARAIHAGK
jgi:monoamine oxidase